MDKKSRTLFSKRLKKWRGKRYQKEAAELLGIGLRTYHAWEQGVNGPSGTCISCVEKIISTP